MRDMDFIVLAGNRDRDDPLARNASVAGKALVPVAGRPMLGRVLAVLAGIPGNGRIAVVAPDMADYREAVETVSMLAGRGVHVTADDTPSLSAAAGFDALGMNRPVLLTTADHPLLKPAWILALAAAAAKGDVDVAVALADWHRFRLRFPGRRRTSYRFRDRRVCGTNLFMFCSPAARTVLGLWRQVEHHRKRPWRIVALLGAGNLARYLVGRMTLDDAFSRLSERLNVRIRPVVLDDPESAVDVDTPADRDLAERVLLEREAGRGED